MIKGGGGGVTKIGTTYVRHIINTELSHFLPLRSLSISRHAEQLGFALMTQCDAKEI